MAKIPEVVEVNQTKAMLGRDKDLKMIEEQLKRTSSNVGVVNKKKVDVTFQLGNPNVNRVENTSADYVNQLLFQKTIGSLNTSSKVLDQIQNLIKLLSNPRVHVDTKKDAQNQIITLLNEIQQIALKSKVGSINLLGQYGDKTIKLPFSDDGKTINMRTYDIVKDIKVLKELLHHVPNQKMIDKLFEQTGIMHNRIGEYQGFLKQIASKLGQGNQMIFQKTQNSLTETSDILNQIQNLMKLLSKPGVHAETKKDVQSQVVTLLSEIEKLALKSKIGNIHLLGQFNNKPIQLRISENGNKINIRTYDILKELHNIKELIGQTPTEKTVDRLTDRITLMYRHVGEYQEFLKQVSLKLDSEFNFKISAELQGGMSAAEAEKMSDITRAIILSAYGVTFFSQLEKKAKEFLTSPLGFFIAICVVIVIIFIYQR